MRSILRGSLRFHQEMGQRLEFSVVEIVDRRHEAVGAHRLRVAEVRRHRCPGPRPPAPEVGEVRAVPHRTDGIAREPADRSGARHRAQPGIGDDGPYHLGVAGLATSQVDPTAFFTAAVRAAGAPGSSSVSSVGEHPPAQQPEVSSPHHPGDQFPVALPAAFENRDDPGPLQHRRGSSRRRRRCRRPGPDWSTPLQIRLFRFFCFSRPPSSVSSEPSRLPSLRLVLLRRRSAALGRSRCRPGPRPEHLVDVHPIGRGPSRRRALHDRLGHTEPPPPGRGARRQPFSAPVGTRTSWGTVSPEV